MNELFIINDLFPFSMELGPTIKKVKVVDADRYDIVEKKDYKKEQLLKSIKFYEDRNESKNYFIKSCNEEIEENNKKIAKLMTELSELEKK